METVTTPSPVKQVFILNRALADERYLSYFLATIGKIAQSRRPVIGTYVYEAEEIADKPFPNALEFVRFLKNKIWEKLQDVLCDPSTDMMTNADIFSVSNALVGCEKAIDMKDTPEK